MASQNVLFWSSLFHSILETFILVLGCDFRLPIPSAATISLYKICSVVNRHEDNFPFGYCECAVINILSLGEHLCCVTSFRRSCQILFKSGHDQSAPPLAIVFESSSYSISLWVLDISSVLLLFLWMHVTKLYYDFTWVGLHFWASVNF